MLPVVSSTYSRLSCCRPACTYACCQFLSIVSTIQYTYIPSQYILTLKVNYRRVSFQTGNRITRQSVAASPAAVDYPRRHRTKLLNPPGFRGRSLHFSTLLCTSLHFSALLRTSPQLSQLSPHYLPMQNRLNTTSNMSSTPTCPPIFPISPAAYRSSSAPTTTSLRPIPGHIV
jgi:hypothetical protein